jgi:hypothetical protein
MQLIPLLFFCTVLLSAHCCASPEDDLKLWRERASKVKAGTPLVEVERLFPQYRPPPTYSITLPSGLTISLPPNLLGDTPLTVTSSTVESISYNVTGDIQVQICYSTASPDKPVSSIHFVFWPPHPKN